jgi:hypothetical protein
MQELWQYRGMMKLIIIIAGVLGLVGCHGDTRWSTDVNSDLLRDTTRPVTVQVALQGKVSCAPCDASEGMSIVATSPTMGMVAHGLMDAIGSYTLNGVAKSGDTLTIAVTVTMGSGLVSKNATASVPEGGGTVTQDFQF